MKIISSNFSQILNMVHKILLLVQLFFAVLLIVGVLLQQKGSGLGTTFGGSSNIYSTKRGIDKVVFRSTIVVSIIFFGVSILVLFF